MFDNVKNYFDDLIRNGVFGVPDFIDGGGDTNVSLLDMSSPTQFFSLIIIYIFLAAIFILSINKAFKIY